jgi:hypothetical protein
VTPVDNDLTSSPGLTIHRLSTGDGVGLL